MASTEQPSASAKIVAVVIARLAGLSTIASTAPKRSFMAAPILGAFLCPRSFNDRSKSLSITELASGTQILGPSDEGDADFRIVLIENAAQGLTLRWHAIKGRVYNAQYAEDLTGGEWTALAADLTAKAISEMTFTDSFVRTANTGFYRV